MRLFRPLIGALLLLAPAVAHAAPNATLTLGANALYDPTAPKFGTSALSGYATLPVGSEATGTTWTWQAWVKTASANGIIQVAYGEGSTGFIGMDASGHAVANLANNNVTITGPTITDSQWHLLEADMSSAGLQFFVDGTSVGTNAQTQTTTATAKFGIGTMGLATGQNVWQGEIDEVSSWSTALHTAAYTPPTAAYTGTEGGLVSLYAMDYTPGPSLTLDPKATWVNAGLYGGALRGLAYAASSIVTSAPQSWAMEVSIQATAPNASQNTVALSYDGTGHWVGVNTACQAAAQLGSGIMGNAGASLCDGNWHTLDAVVIAGQGYLYVDRQLVASGAGDSLPATVQPSIGAFANGANAFPGQVDEVSIWSYPHYTGAASAYTGTESGLLALYHLDSSGADSAVGVTSAGLSMKAIPQNVSAGLITTLSGSYTGTAPTGLSYTVDGGTAQAVSAFSAANGVVSGTIVLPAAGSHTFVFSETNAPTVSATFPPVLISAPTAITPDNTALHYTGWNWTTPTSSGVVSTNAGAYFSTLFTGAQCTLTFDTSADQAPLPEVRVIVDGSAGSTAVYTLASQIPCSPPSQTSTAPWHSLQVVIKSTTETQNRWSAPATGVKFTSLLLAPGAAAKLPSLPSTHIAYFGDSITEGVRTVNYTAANDTDRNDAMSGWAWASAQMLGVEPWIVGFGGSGLVTTGSGGVPPLGQTFGYLSSGVARNLSICPDAIVENEGTNDNSYSSASVQGAEQAVLGQMLAACPRARILVMRPFIGFQAAALQAAVKATASSQVGYVDTTGWFSAANGADDLGIHPTAANDIGILAPLVANAIRPTLVQRSYSYH